MPEAFEDKFSKIWLKDNLIYFHVLTDTLTLEVAKALVAARHAYTKGKDYPHIIFISRLKSVSKEARDYLAKGEAVNAIPACALVSDSVIAKLMANFFMAFNKPPIPIKVFSNQDDALQWISKYREH